MPGKGGGGCVSYIKSSNIPVASILIVVLFDVVSKCRDLG